MKTTAINRRNVLGILGGAALQAGAVSRVQAAANAIAGVSADQAAANEDFWFQVRHAFTVDRNVLNFNNGSLCPAPKIVQEAMQRYWEVTNMQPSLYVDEMLIGELEEVRRLLARDFGCRTEELAVVRNTSEGLHNVIYGIPLKAGDEVVTTTQDYGSMITSFQQRERRDGIKLRQFPYPTPAVSPGELAELFIKNMTPRTKAVLVSHMTFTTGQIFPLKEICAEARKRGIFSIVDGAHGFAHLVFKRDDIGCDFYATSLHKWLTAPVGTGFLYVRKDLIPQVWPLMGAPESMAGDIRKFESIGTTPVAMRNAVTEALAFHHSIGSERKAARLRYLRRRWASRLGENPRIILRNADDPAQTGGIGALTVKGIPGPQLTDLLIKKYRIHVRPRVIAGEFECIRVTPNVYTTLDEVDRFAQAVEEIARG